MRAYFDDWLQDTYNSLVASVNLASSGGHQSQCSGCGHSWTLTLAFSAIQGDIKNGYNNITREAILNSIWDAGTLDNTLTFGHLFWGLRRDVDETVVNDAFLSLSDF